MTVPNAYRDLVLSRVRSAIDSAATLGVMSHPGVKGRLREILIRDLLKPLLPLELGVGTGQIVTSFGQQSTEQDIAIFDRRILPPAVVGSEDAVLPVESVLLAIEVKSMLTAQELKSAHQNALDLIGLSMLSGVRDDAGDFVDQPTAPVQTMLFALGTDLNGPMSNEVARYNRIRENDPPIFTAICVVDRGFATPTEPVMFDLSDPEKPFARDPQPTGRFLVHDSDGRRDEVLRLIATILQLHERIARKRGRPPISGYLL